MDRLADFFPDLLVIASLIVAAVGLAPLASKIGLPGPAAFLAVGLGAGLLGIVPTDELGPVALEEIGALALYAILFQGGLTTGIGRWLTCARPVLLLGLPGTAVTAAAVAAVAHYALGLEWALASFVGIALAPTDPAAVYAVLRGEGGRSRARTVLEGESGFNDPVGISLMVVAVLLVADPDASLGDGAVRFVEELGIGLVGGAVGAFVLRAGLRVTPRLEEGLQGAAVLLGALVIGAATASLHGSGFLAVGNARPRHSPTASGDFTDTWNVSSGSGVTAKRPRCACVRKGVAASFTMIRRPPAPLFPLFGANQPKPIGHCCPTSSLAA
jgi:cell volume regulation protein A